MREGNFRLTDGRVIAFADWGSEEAPCLFYFHGSPGCRRELVLPVSVLGPANLAVRVIALNRPGFGSSTFQPRRSMLDWPGDVAEVADRLGIDRFSVLGASGGGPYALATGFALPDRVERIGLVVGSCPREAPGMDTSIALNGPSKNRLIRRVQYGLIGLAVRTGRVEAVVDRAVATLADRDRRAMDDPRLRRWFVDMFPEAFAGLGRGAAYEQGLYLRSWGFDLAAIGQPVFLWYAALDRNVPAEAGRWLADRLQNARYKLWPDHAHFTWAVSRDVLEVLTTTAGLDPQSATPWE